MIHDDIWLRETTILTWKVRNHDGRMWNLLTNMMCMYIYISCVFILCQTSLHPNIISPTEISDLSLGKLCLRRRTCQFCAQMNSHVINGPFYEPLVRLRRHKNHPWVWHLNIFKGSIANCAPSLASHIVILMNYLLFFFFCFFWYIISLELYP